MHPSPTHPRRPRSLWHLSHSLIRPCPTLVLGLHLARTASVTVQHLPVLGQATTLVIHSPSYALLGDNRGWIYTLSDDDQCTVDSNLGTDSEARGLLHTYAHTHTYIHTYIPIDILSQHIPRLILTVRPYLPPFTLLTAI